jgi:hypothetical protein
MTLGQLPFDVPLFVNQASLNHAVAEELFHSGSQRVITVENNVKAMLTRDPSLDDSPHQFPCYLKALAAAQDKIQDLLVAVAVDPECNHRSLLLAQADPIEHQPAPNCLTNILASQLFNEFLASFLPES